MEKKGIIGIAISVLLIAGILWFLDIEQVIERVALFGLVPFLVGNIIYAGIYFVRSIKWKKILDPFVQVGLKETFYILVLGFFVNGFAPVRLGEVVRAFTLSKKTALGKAKALSTIIIDRLSDVIALVVLLFVGLVFSNVYSDQIFNAGLIVLALGLLSLVVLLFNNRFAWITTRLLFWAPEKFKRILKDLVFAGDSLKGKQSILVWFWSFVVWLGYALLYYYLLSVLGLGIPISGIVLITMVLSLSAMIPSGPGYLGTTEVVTVFLFQLFGLDINAAISFAIVSRLVMYTSTVVLGMLSLKGLALSFSDLRIREEKPGV